MRVAAYVRVSTEDQARNGVSLADQEAKIRAYADLYGHEIVQLIADPGVSAKNLKRPGVQELLSLVKTGKVEGIVVAKLDRLTRSVRDLADLIALCNKRIVALISVAEQIDTSTAAGRMVANMLGVISQWERETIGERTSAAIQYKKHNGRAYSGRFAPYGYAKSDGMLVPVAQEQEAIDVIMDLSSKHGVRAVCRLLEAKSIPTRSARAKWHPKVVAKIIRDAEVRSDMDAQLQAIAA